MTERALEQVDLNLDLDEIRVFTRNLFTPNEVICVISACAQQFIVLHKGLEKGEKLEEPYDDCAQILTKMLIALPNQMKEPLLKALKDRLGFDVTIMDGSKLKRQTDEIIKNAMNH